MIFIVYIIIIIAALAMVYFGHMQGQSQFYMSVFSAAIIAYCVYLDYQKRQEKKREEKSSNNKTTSVLSSKSKKNSSVSIHDIAHKSTKDKDLNK